MGNICCQTDVHDDPFERILPYRKDYIPAQFDESDEFMNEHMRDKYQQSEEGKNDQQRTLVKHKTDDRYFYGKWNKQGLPEGQGKIYQPERIFIEGNFVKGFPEGQSRVTFISSQCEYEGELQKGVAQGHGKFVNMKNKYHFEGQWEQSKPKKGTLTLHDDKNVTNIIYDDFKAGHGVINYKDFRKYEGQIDTNKMVPHGEGTVYFSEKDKKRLYSGEWNYGQIHGKGHMEWLDESEYDGGYFHGKRQGDGKFTFPSKSCYQGSWFDGLQNGAGTLFDKEGNIEKKGLWECGKFSKTLNEEEMTAQRSKDIELISQKKEKQRQQLEQSHHEAVKYEQNPPSYDGYYQSKGQSIKRQTNQIYGTPKIKKQEEYTSHPEIKKNLF